MRQTKTLEHRDRSRPWTATDLSKAELLSHLQALLAEKVRAVEAEITSTLDARNSDTKSSAGDKHEVGRAMIQQELDRQEAQLAKLRTFQQDLARIPMESVSERAVFGSLVHTDQGPYLLAIGLGPVVVNGTTCFAVSLASPIGQSLKHKKAGDVTRFNGRTITVLRIS